MRCLRNFFTLLDTDIEFTLNIKQLQIARRLRYGFTFEAGG